MIRVRDENINTPEFWDWCWNNEAEWTATFGPPVDRWEAVRANLEYGRVVDFGGGRGEFLGWLGSRFHRTLVDHSDEACRVARENGWADETMVADVCATGLASGVFDGVFCQEVLEHVEDPVALAEELFRVARPGGMVSVSVPKANTPDDRQHVWSFDADDLRGLGFSDVVEAGGPSLVGRAVK